MEIKATTRMVRISASKARDTARRIQGLPVNDAVEVLRFTPKKAARLIEKTLKSAIANAGNNNNYPPEVLMVKEASIGEGATLYRYRARARGGAGHIRKRTSHIRIVLKELEQKEEVKEEKGKAKAEKKQPQKKEK